MNDIYQSSDYKRSRKAYTVQCAFEYFVSILVTDAFLAKLLAHMGISDSAIGIISSLVSFSFLFQLLAIYLMSHLKNTKKTVLLFDTMGQMFFLGIYLVPFLPVTVRVKTVIVILCILFAYICKYLIYSLCFKWANSYVAPEKRGDFSSVKEMISLFSGIIFTLIAGYVVDYYESIQNLEGAFILLAIAMLILNICNFVSLLLIKNETQQEVAENKPNLRVVLQNTLGNRSFVYVIIMTSLWEMGRMMTVGFLGTFKTSDLLLSVGAVQVINMVANLCRLVISRPFGRYSDKTSYAKAFRLAMMLAAAGFAINIFTTKNNWWCIIIFTILYSVSFAGTNQNSYNITYSYVKGEYIVQAMAINRSISGILGFGAALVGSRILQAIQSAGNSFMGFSVYGQQVLSAISMCIILVAVLFSALVMEKQKRMVQ